MRTFRSCTVILSLILVGLGSSCSRVAEPAPQPNVLLILVDALRADSLGVNGHSQDISPFIDSLAAEGVNFDTAISPSTWTKPSIASLFTCVYPTKHRVLRAAVANRRGLQTHVLHDRLVTMAERFQQAEYATGAIVNQVHLKEQFGFSQGFDHYQATRRKSAPQLNLRLLAWIDSLADKKFFAYLHYLDAHWPYTQILPQNVGRFGQIEMRSEPPGRGNRVDAWVEKLKHPLEVLPLKARYDQEINFVDGAIGHLMTSLAERGVLENTIVIITSDHGEGFYEHSKLQHGYAPYEELIRIPLIIRLPASMRAHTGTVDTPISLIDVMPTLLDLLQLPSEPQCQGVSYAHQVLAKDGPQNPRVLISESIDSAAARSQDRKLILFSDDRREFYDLKNDPLELSPKKECVKECQQASEFLQDHLAGSVAVKSQTTDVDRQTEEDLKRLGYLQ